MPNAQPMPIPNRPFEEKSLAKRHFGAMAGVLLSRLLGVGRTIIINAYFGANTTLDAFNTAFRFPNSLRDLFADGALSSAFTKSLVDARTLGLEKERELIAITMGFFLTVTLLLASLGAFFAEPFLHLISDSRFEKSGGLILASHLFQWLAFYLPLTMLNAIAMAILGVNGLTFRAMNGSLFLSIGMVIGTLAIAPCMIFYGYDPVYGVTFGALMGAFLQLIYQVSPLYKVSLWPFPNFNPMTWFGFKPLHEIMWMMAPRALGQGATTLALMVNTYFALKIGNGAMTLVTTTIIIIQVPIGLFGVATGFASLPVLTEAIFQRQFKRFSELLTQSLDTCLWLAIFTTFGFALFIVPLYMLVFQHGKITFDNTLENCLCICAYSSGIVFGAGSKVLMNTLYALNATRQIVINSIIYLILNTLLSFLLVPNFGLVGLGLAFGLASGVNYWFNYLLIYWAHQKYDQSSPYIAGGPHYRIKNLLYSFLSIAGSLLGIYLTRAGWQNFSHYAAVPLTNISAAGILIFGGAVYLMIFLAMTYWIGPTHLAQLVRQKIRLT